jgi:hypothetical protein
MNMHYRYANDLNLYVNETFPGSLVSNRLQ